MNKINRKKCSLKSAFLHNQFRKKIKKSKVLQNTFFVFFYCTQSNENILIAEQCAKRVSEAMKNHLPLHYNFFSSPFYLFVKPLRQLKRTLQIRWWHCTGLIGLKNKVLLGDQIIILFVYNFALLFKNATVNGLVILPFYEIPLSNLVQRNK